MYLSQNPVYGPQPQPQPMAPIPYRPGYVPTTASSSNFQAFLNSLPTIIGTLKPQQQAIAPGTLPPQTTDQNNKTLWYVLGGAGILLGALYLMRKK